MSELRVGRRTLEVKRLDKTLFPDDGISKGDVIRYYRDVAETMLRHLRGRPLSLQRFPDGIDSDGFFQQDRPDYFPDWIDDIALERAGDGAGGPVRHVLCNDEATLAYLANQGVITLHGWLSRATSPGCPDRLVFDLDPPGDDFSPVVAAARRVGELLEEAGLTPYVMTTGSRGLHVAAPLDESTPFDEVRKFARDMAGSLASREPDALTVEQRKNRRRGRLYLDVMRNAYGQTAVVPYSLRPLLGAPVATPLDWDELSRPGLSPGKYGLGNVRRRLAQKSEPWRNFRRHAASARLAAQRIFP